MDRRMFIVTAGALATTALTPINAFAANYNLNEIQDKLDAGGFTNYPGVVRMRGNLRISPTSGYLFSDALEPGSALPAVKSGSSLYKASQSKRITIAPFRRKRNATIVRKIEDFSQFQLFQAEEQEVVMVPEFFVELAEQNGVAPHEMITHVHNYRIGQTESLDDFLASQRDILTAFSLLDNLVVINQELVDERTAELERLRDLAGQSETAREALQSIIDNLEADLQSITADLVLEALVNEQLRVKIEAAVNLQDTVVRERLGRVTTVTERREAINELIAMGNPLIIAAAAAQHAQGNLEVDVMTVVHDLNVVAQQYIDDEGHGLASREALARAAQIWCVGCNVDVDALSNYISFAYGYIEGFNKGYEAGYDRGYEDGYADGYVDGYVDGVNSVSNILTEGDDV